jgi:hypothetical protein
LKPRRAKAAPNLLFWLLPLALAAVQWQASLTSMHEIRYEELAESVRSVFWLDRRLVYDGVYSNVGWYGTLLIAYKIFGFSLVQAKFVRLGIHVAGLYAAASLLARSLTTRVAIVPLALIGLSPTLLYLTTLQTSYGLDLPYAAICLWMIVSTRFRSGAAAELVRTFLCGAVAMVAAMSYPTFLWSVPSLVIVAVWLVRTSPGTGQSRRYWPRHVASAAVGLALPLVAAFLYVQTRNLLIYDPGTQAGLFRGGGRLGFNLALASQAIRTLAGDLFVRGQSYYFELTRPEFSGVLGAVGLAAVVGTAGYLFVKNRAPRAVIAAASAVLIMSVVIPSLSTEGPPGIRRSTGVLAAYFTFFALAWQFYSTSRTLPTWSRRVGLAVCLLLPLNHVLGVPSLLSDLSDNSIYRNSDWFTIETTPSLSLAHLLAQVKQGQPLSCPIDRDGRITPCRYQEVYPAIAGFLEWNGQPSQDIRALDWRTGRTITLTPALWSDHYYPTCTRLESCR